MPGWVDVLESVFESSRWCNGKGKGLRNLTKVGQEELLSRYRNLAFAILDEDFVVG